MITAKHQRMIGGNCGKISSPLDNWGRNAAQREFSLSNKREHGKGPGKSDRKGKEKSIRVSSLQSARLSQRRAERNQNRIQTGGKPGEKDVISSELSEGRKKHGAAGGT